MKSVTLKQLAYRVSYGGVVVAILAMCVPFFLLPHPVIRVGIIGYIVFGIWMMYVWHKADPSSREKP